MDGRRPLGLQRRIMLYVLAGLTALFAVVGFVGLAAIDEAADRVFDERLATAHTTAGIVQRDFARLAADMRLGAASVPTTDAQAIAEELVQSLGAAARYDFFSVIGACLANAAGDTVAAAWRSPPLRIAEPACAVPSAGTDGFALSVATWEVDSSIALADIGVDLGTTSGGGASMAVAHVVSRNSTTAFDPAAYGGRRADPGVDRAGGDTGYTLEILDAGGRTVLAIGPDERLGGSSPHFPAVRDLMVAGEAGALIDQGMPETGLEPHVMAVVPLGSTPFYLLLEQPTDVALALPNQLRGRLAVLTIGGFAGALFVAWVTTRRVVRPTEELTAAAERMARGDLASPIAVQAQDEIGLLARSLEEMRRRLGEANDRAELANRVLEERVAERTARLGQLLRRTISAQEDERRGLARELHDETAQALAALSISLDRARDDLVGEPGAAREHIQRARAISERLLVETRRMILGLRPSVLDDLGLGPAIAWYGESTLEGQDVAFRVNPEARTIRLPPHVETSLFRVAQEALSNVGKHARASRVTVGLSATPDMATLEIADDGIGFDVEATPGAASQERSVGLAGMQERVSLLGGTLTVHSRPGAGTRVVVELPIGDEASR